MTFHRENDGMKRKKPNGQAHANDLSASEIARLAGISRQRVCWKLKQGKSAAQILQEAEAWRQRELLRQLPSTPVMSDNVAGMLSFAQEQTAKEHWLRKIREVEYLEMTHRLIPKVWVQNWAAHCLALTRQALLWAPSELRDELSMESDPIKCGQVLERWVDRTLSHLRTMKIRFESPPEGD
jgi:hypothetical protein